MAFVPDHARLPRTIAQPALSAAGTTDKAAIEPSGVGTSPFKSGIVRWGQATMENLFGAAM